MPEIRRGYKIAVIPGDGTGPEVIKEGMKVLDTAGEKYGFELDAKYFGFNGDEYLRGGKLLSNSDVDGLRNNHHAIFLGAIGHPKVKPGILERGILLKMRFDLDQYINLRPARLYPGVKTPLADKKPEDIDFIVVRENTGGLYTGQGGVSRPGTPHEVATQVMVYDRQMVDRCLKYAFMLAQTRKEQGKPGKLTLVHKTNVLTNCGDLWKRAFEDMGESFPQVTRDYNHVDACTMFMVKRPEEYDVLVTENMFGDIITDLAAEIQGGMGIAAGGNINPKGVSMFEPIGGSAPKYTGQNVINPLAAIEAGRMMMEHLGEKDAASAIQRGVMHACTRMKSMSAGKMGYSTSGVGDLVSNYIAGEGKTLG